MLAGLQTSGSRPTLPAPLSPVARREKDGGAWSLLATLCHLRL